MVNTFVPLILCWWFWLLFPRWNWMLNNKTIFPKAHTPKHYFGNEPFVKVSWKLSRSIEAIHISKQIKHTHSHSTRIRFHLLNMSGFWLTLQKSRINSGNWVFLFTKASGAMLFWLKIAERHLPICLLNGKFCMRVLQTGGKNSLRF